MNGVTYDLIVIGSGSAGLSVSLFAAETGLRTLLAEKNERHIGGDCLNWGCVPSKALIHVANMFHEASNASAFGLNINGRADISRVTAYIKNAQETIRRHENAEWLRSKGIEVAIGAASFTDKNSIEVDGKIYHGKKIVLATGSRPVVPPIPGLENVQWYNNETIFSITSLPDKLLVLGGGPVGIELGQAMQRLGCKVMVADRNERILNKEEPAISDILQARLEQEGIRFLLNATIESFPTSNEALIRYKDTTEETVRFDALLLSAGRKLEFETLHLEKAGIKTSDGKIICDEHLQTTNPDVFVCGDVAGGMKFSHVAEYHARIILNNLFSPFKRRTDDTRLSWVTFTDPQVATFGRNEEMLNKSNIAFVKTTFDFSDDDRAVTDDYQYGKLILYLTPPSVLKKQKILGGTMIAPQAAEMIQELIVVMNENLSTDVLFNKIYPYPASARVNQMLLVKEKQKSFTPLMKRLLRVLFRFRN